MDIRVRKKAGGLVGKREPLYKGLYHAVRRRIELGQLQPGSRAPSEADLIAEFRVSSTTARRCLNDLETAGYVERVQGKGTFVCPPPALARTRQIGVLFNELFSLAEVFISQELKGIGSAMENEEFQPMLLAAGMVRRSPDPPAALLELVKRQELEGLILLSPMPLPWLTRVLDEGLPIASINFKYEDPRIASATIDADKSMQNIARRLRDVGHRKLVDLSRTFPAEYLEGVALTRASKSTFADFERNKEQFYYFEPENTKQVVQRHLMSADPPTAFLGVGYELALDIREAIKATGRRIPEDVSLLFLGAPAGPTDLAGEVVPVVELGRWAAQVVRQGIEHGGMPVGHHIVLSTRENTGTTLGAAACG